MIKVNGIEAMSNAKQALNGIDQTISDILELAHKNGVTALARFKFKQDIQTIRQYIEAQEWQEIESAPYTDKAIIIRNKFGDVGTRKRVFDEDYHGFGDGAFVYKDTIENATHWKPIQPPQGADDEPNR